MAISREKLMELKNSFKSIDLPNDIDSRINLLEHFAGQIVVIEDSKKGLAGGIMGKTNSTRLYRLENNGSSELYDFHNLIALYHKPQRI